MPRPCPSRARGHVACLAQARRQYKVPYPNMYAVPGVNMQVPGEGSSLVAGAAENGKSSDGAISAEAAYKFNCVQRGHQNMLEKMPYVLVMLLASTFSYPLVGGFAGLVFLLGRSLYAYGYRIEPKKRSYGSIEYVGILTLYAITLAFAIELFRGSEPY